LVGWRRERGNRERGKKHQNPVRHKTNKTTRAPTDRNAPPHNTRAPPFVKSEPLSLFTALLRRLSLALRDHTFDVFQLRSEFIFTPISAASEDEEWLKIVIVYVYV
jgi:hypothetical protein